MMDRSLRTLAAAVAMSIVAAPGAVAEIALWGTTFAQEVGQGDTTLDRAKGPIRVGARLPDALGCQVAVAARAVHVPVGPALVDPLVAAPVTVVLEPRPCLGGWKDGWVDFVVTGAGAVDVLDLRFVSTDGRPLSAERVAVSTSNR